MEKNISRLYLAHFMNLYFIFYKISVISLNNVVFDLRF